MKNAMHALGSLEWQAIALVLLLFGSGAAVGAAFEHAHGPRRGLPARGGAAFGGAIGARPGPGRPPPYLEELNLTGDEHERIRTILDSQRPKVDSAMASVLAAAARASDSTFSEIRSILTPEQQTQFDRDRPRRELCAGHAGRTRPWPGFGGRGRGGPPPGPPGRGGPPD